MRRFLIASIAAIVLLPASAQAAGYYNSTAYRNSVTVPNMLQHSYKLQQIADTSGGNRVAGSPGNDKTVNYIINTMRAAGWATKRQAFTFPFFEEHTAGTFTRTSPDPHTYVNGTEFDVMEYAGSGDVTAAVVPVDVVVPIAANPPNTSTSGCETADFDGFTPGNIALLQRGSCSFGQKVANAEAANAAAVIVFNEGQPGQNPEREGLLLGTLGAPASIPALGVSYVTGVELVEQFRNGDSPTAHITTDTTSETRTTYNVIADSPGGDLDRTVAVVAHNDSVAEGPGINDDGSGIAMNLELAKQLGKKGLAPTNHVRFLWVGAEEANLLGSTYYVEHLPDAQLQKIIAMLDFDMVASMNYARQVYDGDGSVFGQANSGPNGSGLIEAMFMKWFTSRSQAALPIPFDGRSDYVAFTDAGIPAGGIFTGAEGIKTVEEQALFGGIAGQPYDPCYHQACDTVNNLNLQAFGEMKDAAADVLYQLALWKGPVIDGRPIGGTTTQATAQAQAKGRATREFHGETAQR